MTLDIKIESTKELIKSLTEVFSPFSESLGLLGDRVRIYRQLSLLRCIKRAQEIAKDEGLILKEPHLKFLVSYIEDCSLEDPSDEILIDMWAKLLTSAATSPDTQHNVFIRILRELTPNEAKIIEYIVSENTHQFYKEFWHLEDVEISWNDSFVYMDLKDSIDCIGSKLTDNFPFHDLEKIYRSMAESPGSVVSFFDIAKGEKNKYPLESIYTCSTTKIQGRNFDISISILKSFGLINEYKSEKIWIGEYVFEIYAYYITLFGVHFVQSCTQYPLSRRKVD